MIPYVVLQIIVNKELEGDTWKTIKSEVKLLHINTSQMLRVSNLVNVSGCNLNNIIKGKTGSQYQFMRDNVKGPFTLSDCESERKIFLRCFMSLDMNSSMKSPVLNYLRRRFRNRSVGTDPN